MRTEQIELNLEEGKDKGLGSTFMTAYNDADSTTRLGMLDALRTTEKEKLSLEEKVEALEEQVASLQEQIGNGDETIEMLKERFERSGLLLGNVPEPPSSAPGFFQHMTRYTADELNSAGLIGADNLYRMFHSHFIDPHTEVLIKQNKFRQILRDAFHIKASTSELPKLKADCLREGYAGVFAVFCPKRVPTQSRLAAGTLSPTYVGGEGDHIRANVRYTWKGIRYLTSKWEKLVDDAYFNYGWRTRAESYDAS